jgi:S1-C subfamily serine protease
MTRKVALPVFVSVLVVATIACQALSQVPQAPAPVITPVPTVAAAQVGVSTVSQVDVVQEQEVLTALYQRVNSGIVAIKVDTPDGGSLGSGFVYDTEGHIITNDHVVGTANQVEIDFPSGYKIYGSVVGTDLDTDLAVIKVDAPAQELHPLTLGDSDTLKVGQTVIAIGNPFGLDGTMTTGIVSALGRTMESDRTAPGGGHFSAGDIIQTDAAINPGNSGGPLFNLSGEVIGINRAIRTTNFTTNGEPLNSGIGFAISINIIKRVVPALITNGKYDYPFLGISSISDLSLQDIQALGLSQTSGAYVTSVSVGSPADQAGIKAGTRQTSIHGLNAGGDLIVAIDGQPVLSFDNMLSYLMTHKSPGDVVVMTVVREGQKMDIPLTLGKRP